MPEKYQEEIEEILRQADADRPTPPPAAASPRPAPDLSRILREGHQPHQPRFNLSHRWPRVTPGKVGLLGLILFVVGAIWWGALMWIGLALLAAAYLLFFVSPRHISYEKRWRGNPLEDRLSPWQRFVRWLKN